MSNNEAESEVIIFYLEDDDNYDQQLDAFNEMHQEAQNLVIANSLLKGKLRWHVDKLVEIQKKSCQKKNKKNDSFEKEKNNSSCCVYNPIQPFR